MHLIGIQRGDILFSHVGLGSLGYPREGRSMEAACEVLGEAVLSVIGDEGTWLVPTYTYSFAKNELYDPLQTPSTVGPFSEYFRTRAGVLRSFDPMLSVAGRGPRAAGILGCLPKDCFGDDCVYDRLTREGAKLFNVGVGFYYATFIHHIEQRLKVPYRFLKMFYGHVSLDGRIEKQGWRYFARILVPEAEPDLRRLETEMRHRGAVRSAVVGRSGLWSVSCGELRSTGEEAVHRDPWYLAVGPARDLLAAERQRVPVNFFQDPPADADSSDLARAIYALPRDLVSDGCDRALEILSTKAPVRIHRYPTGTLVGDRPVPEKWTCHEAYLETASGRRILSCEDDPFCIASYSQPFSGEVDRETLFKHLTVHPTSRAEAPFRDLSGDRDWGFCCGRRVYEELLEDRYRVMIRTSFSYDALKVGEILIDDDPSKKTLLWVSYGRPTGSQDLERIIVVLASLRDGAGGKLPVDASRLLLVPGPLGLGAFLNENPAPKILGALES